MKNLNDQLKERKDKADKKKDEEKDEEQIIPLKDEENIIDNP